METSIIKWIGCVFFLPVVVFLSGSFLAICGWLLAAWYITYGRKQLNVLTETIRKQKASATTQSKRRPLPR